MIYIFYLNILAVVFSNPSLYNENCTNCYREAKDHFSEIITRHWNEVTISKNPLVKTNSDILALKCKCKGVIITSNMAVTLASFFGNNTNTENYVVYTGYLIREVNETFHAHNVSNIYLHPSFNGETNMDNVAVIKVITNFILNIAGRAIAILPDNEINFAETKEVTCTILIYQADTFGTDVFHSLAVDLLTKEECADFIGLNNFTLSLRTSSFCVKAHSSPNKKINITQGTICLCDDVIRGIVLQNYIGANTRDPIPVVDIGLHTTWIRTRMINLEYVRAASSRHGYRKLILCFVVLHIFCSTYI